MEPRVVIVGAGPAGTRCAETLLAGGICPILIDENRRDGGQIYRRQPEGFRRDYHELYGSEADKAAAIHQTFDALRARIDYRPETLAWNVYDKTLHTVHESRQRDIPFDALILCTGASDRLMPVKGWNLAGTFSLGGAQVALKSQAVSIGHKVVFMGSGPLLYMVAVQYLKAGADVAAVLDTSPMPLRLIAMPKLMARPGVLFNGLKLIAALRRQKVPLYFGITPMEVLGRKEEGVQGVVFSDAKGEQHHISCDAVALGYHLRPETQLADLAKCAFEFDALTRQWILQLDEDGRTSTPGIYAAGDGARVRGADAAESAGRLVALAVLKDLGRSADAATRVKERERLVIHERFRQGLMQAFPWPSGLAVSLPDEAIVCRCEAITAGELRAVVNEKGAREANRAKAFSRVGMGRCQGRYCAHAGAEVIAQEAGVPIESVGRLRGQAPVRPVTFALEEDIAQETPS